MAEEDSTGINDANDRDSDFEAGVEESIEEERSRLMKAEALLECLICTLSHTGSESADSPPSIGYCGYVIIAKDLRTLIKQVVNGLDTVNILQRGRAAKTRTGVNTAI